MSWFLSCFPCCCNTTTVNPVASNDNIGSDVNTRTQGAFSRCTAPPQTSTRETQHTTTTIIVSAVLPAPASALENAESLMSDKQNVTQENEGTQENEDTQGDEARTQTVRKKNSDYLEPLADNTPIVWHGPLTLSSIDVSITTVPSSTGSTESTGSTRDKIFITGVQVRTSHRS